MYDRFSRESMEIIAISQEEAEGWHHSFVGTEHLLLGLRGTSDDRSDDGVLPLLQLGIDSGMDLHLLAVVNVFPQLVSLASAQREAESKLACGFCIGPQALIRVSVRNVDTLSHAGKLVHKSVRYDARCASFHDGFPLDQFA